MLYFLPPHPQPSFLSIPTFTASLISSLPSLSPSLSLIPLSFFPSYSGSLHSFSLLTFTLSPIPFPDLTPYSTFFPTTSLTSPPPSSPLSLPTLNSLPSYLPSLTPSSISSYPHSLSPPSLPSAPFFFSSLHTPPSFPSYPHASLSPNPKTLFVFLSYFHLSPFPSYLTALLSSLFSLLP